MTDNKNPIKVNEKSITMYLPKYGTTKWNIITTDNEIVQTRLKKNAI